MNNDTVSPFVIFNFFLSLFFFRNSEKEKRKPCSTEGDTLLLFNASKPEFRIRHILTGGSVIFWIRIHLKMHQNSKCQSEKFKNAYKKRYRNYRKNYIKNDK